MYVCILFCIIIMLFWNTKYPTTLWVAGIKSPKTTEPKQTESVEVVGGWQSAGLAMQPWRVFVDSMTLTWSLLGSQSRLVGACGLTMSALSWLSWRILWLSSQLLSLCFCSFASSRLPNSITIACLPAWANFAAQLWPSYRYPIIIMCWESFV